MLKLIISSVRNYCTKSISPKDLSNMKPVRKARYDGRSKKRKWEERRTDKGEAFDLKKLKQEETPSPQKADTERIKRKKFAILMGYSGANYFGMQRNPYTKTIEEEFFKALHSINLINDECFSQVQNMQFQRAARTDKGVSAARQIVSLKLPEVVDITKINEQLPDVIRVFGIKRVTKGFNSKSQCDGRTYLYMLPTISFAPLLENFKQEEFRLDGDTFHKVNRVLGMFVGTKNFHNFTAKKKPSDPSTTRYIKSFTCEQPFVRKDVEFAVMKVRGQSFMLHQIRKMVGLTIAIVRNQATEDILMKVFSLEKVAIPRAPGLGLVLDHVHYDRYNYRYGEDGMHEKLTWEEVDDQVNEFKEKHIYPTIINTEINENSMIQWIEAKLSRHTYDDFAEDEEEGNGDDDDDDCQKNYKTSFKKEIEDVKLESENENVTEDTKDLKVESEDKSKNEIDAADSKGLTLENEDKSEENSQKINVDDKDVVTEEKTKSAGVQ